MRYNLSNTELEIMEFFWSKDTPLTRKEITYQFNEIVGKNWKRQTLNTFLVRLIEKGFLVKEGRSFHAIIDKTGHESLKAKGILDTMYHSSLKEFVAALSGSETISQEDSDEIMNLLEKMK